MLFGGDANETLRKFINTSRKVLFFSVVYTKLLRELKIAFNRMLKSQFFKRLNIFLRLQILPTMSIYSFWYAQSGNARFSLIFSCDVIT